ncbi:putative cation/H+ exchanger, cation/H+ exchanger, CPA1 family [Helianthus debilis subsp. tardiflorus]
MDDPVNAVLFVGMSLVLGVASRHLLRGTRVPYTAALLVIGIAMGSLGANIDPDLLLAVFLPPLLFESSFSMDVHHIKKCMAQMVLLAGPGVLISTFFLGSALKVCFSSLGYHFPLFNCIPKNMQLFFPYNWSWKTSLLLGGLLGATDPVAVIAFLKELGANKKLTTLIEGESLMNDGYQVFTALNHQLSSICFSSGW